MQTDREPTFDASSLLDLLKGASQEVHAIAIDVVALGEALSGEAAAAASFRLQEFDMLGQRILASARLLAAIEAGLRGADDAVSDAVEAVPFENIRRRLRAFGGSGACVADEASDMEWF